MGKKMNSTIGSVLKLGSLIKSWRPNPWCSDPSDVPMGHVAIMVGCERRRFIVGAKQLTQPAFLRLLDDAEEEYDFNYTDGPVSIPCDVPTFMEALRLGASP